jgi:hypothetical protein
MLRSLLVLCLVAFVVPAYAQSAKTNKAETTKAAAKEQDARGIEFSLSSVRSGAWSDPKTWRPARPAKGTGSASAAARASSTT